jgi:hypothetical protein
MCIGINCDDRASFHQLPIQSHWPH